MEEILKELEKDIYDCKLDCGDGGNNVNDIDCAIETFDKLKKALTKGKLLPLKRISFSKTEVCDHEFIPMKALVKKCHKCNQISILIL